MSKICIVGGGSIGSVIAYYLYKSGVSNITIYYGSRESVDTIKREGGLFIVYSGIEYFIPIQPRHYSEPLDLCEYVINAVKAYSVENTIELMKTITRENSLILMIQNGFGSLELVEDKLSNRIVCCGVVFIGAERVLRNKTIHHGGNKIISGCRGREKRIELENLASLFREGGCDFRIVEDVDLYRWLKLGLNAVVNPLTAITLSRNKIVLTKPGIELARIIINEVVEAAARTGYALDPEKLLKLVVENVEIVAENYSSMVQDLLTKSRTEIDYINGYVARILGEKSVNAILTKIVHLIEESIRQNTRAKTN